MNYRAKSWTYCLVVSCLAACGGKQEESEGVGPSSSEHDAGKLDAGPATAIASGTETTAPGDAAVPSVSATATATARPTQAVPSMTPPALSTARPVPTDTGAGGAPVFVDWEALPLVAPEGCSVENQAQLTTDVCQVELTCDGAWLTSANCQPNGAGAWDCDCRSNSEIKTLTASGNELIDVCQASMDFCQGTTEQNADAAQCTPQGGSADAFGCSTRAQCDYEWSYDSGVEVNASRPVTADCWLEEATVAGDNGKWACECNANDGAFERFYVDSAADTLDTCTRAERVCGHLAELEPSGDVVCRPAGESFDIASCNTSANCLLEGEVQGVQLSMDSALYIYCYESDAAWTCSVSDHLATREVSVPQPSAPIQACRQVLNEEIAQLGQPEPTDGGVPDAGQTETETDAGAGPEPNPGSDAGALDASL